MCQDCSKLQIQLHWWGLYITSLGWKFKGKISLYHDLGYLGIHFSYNNKYTNTHLTWNYSYATNKLFRLLKLLEEISQEEESKTIIFVETKRKVDDITRSIGRYGWVFMKWIKWSNYGDLSFHLHLISKTIKWILMEFDIANAKNCWESIIWYDLVQYFLCFTWYFDWTYQFSHTFPKENYMV